MTKTAPDKKATGKKTKSNHSLWPLNGSLIGATKYLLDSSESALEAVKNTVYNSTTVLQNTAATAEEIFEDLKVEAANLVEEATATLVKYDDKATTALANVVLKADNVPLHIYEPDVGSNGAKYSKSQHRTFFVYLINDRQKLDFKGIFLTDDNGTLCAPSILSVVLSRFKKGDIFEKKDGQYKHLSPCTFNIGQKYLIIPIPLTTLFSRDFKLIPSDLYNPTVETLFTQNWINYTQKPPQEWLDNALNNDLVNWPNKVLPSPRPTCPTGSFFTISLCNNIIVLPTFIEFAAIIYELLDLFNSQKLFYDNIIGYDQQNAGLLEGVAAVIDIVRTMPQAPSEVKHDFKTSLADFKELKKFLDNQYNAATNPDEASDPIEVQKSINTCLEELAGLLRSFSQEIQVQYIEGKNAVKKAAQFEGYCSMLNAICQHLSDIIKNDHFKAHLTEFSRYDGSLDKNFPPNKKSFTPERREADKFFPGMYWVQDIMVGKVMVEAYIAIANWPDEAKRNSFFMTEVNVAANTLSYSMDNEQIQVIQDIFSKEELHTTFPFLLGKTVEKMYLEIQKGLQITPQIGSEEAGLLAAAQSGLKTALEIYAASPLDGIWADQWGLPSNLAFILNTFMGTCKFSNDSTSSVLKGCLRFIRANMGLLHQESLRAKCSFNIKSKSAGRSKSPVGVANTRKVRDKVLSYFTPQNTPGKDWEGPPIVNGMMSAYGLFCTIIDIQELCEEIKNKPGGADFEDLRNAFVLFQQFGLNTSGLIGKYIEDFPVGKLLEDTFVHLIEPVVCLNELVDRAELCKEYWEDKMYDAFVLTTIQTGAQAIKMTILLKRSSLYFKSVVAQRAARKQIVAQYSKIGITLLKNELEERVAKVVAVKVLTRNILRLSGMLSFLELGFLAYDLHQFVLELVNDSYQSLYKPYAVIAAHICIVNQRMEEPYTVYLTAKDSDIVLRNPPKTKNARTPYDLDKLFGTIGEGENARKISWKHAVDFFIGRDDAVAKYKFNMQDIMQNVDTLPAAFALRELNIFDHDTIATILGISPNKLTSIYQNEADRTAKVIASHLDPTIVQGNPKVLEHKKTIQQETGN